MSADNGIYIGKFPDGYRVVHAQAIENTFDSDHFPQELADAYTSIVFSNSELYTNSEAAWAKAREMYEDLMASDFPVCEYGVSQLEYEREIIPLAEAHEIHDTFWNNHRGF